MMKKGSLSKQEKIDILKRLIKKFSTSSLSKRETIELLKRAMLVILGRKETGGDSAKELKGLSGESKK